MRNRTPLAVAAVWALAVGTASGASPQAGDPFPLASGPAFAGKEFVNTPEVDAKNLRGRLVLCEVFSTTWKPCQDQVVHLDELQAKYAEKGLALYAVSPEPRSNIDKFVEKTGAKHPIVIVEASWLKDLDVHSFPSSFLVGPDGRVIWTGHPGSLSDATIEEHLGKVRLPPPFPGKVAPLEKAFDRSKYGEVATKVEKLLLGTALSEDERKAAEGVRDWVAWFGSSRMEGARADESSGKAYEAWLVYEELADSFKGAPLAAEAAKAAAEVLADKDRKREVDAGKRLEKAREQARDLDEEKAKKLFEQVAEKYEGTRAATRAKELADALKAG